MPRVRSFRRIVRGVRPGPGARQGDDPAAAGPMGDVSVIIGRDCLFE